MTEATDFSTAKATDTLLPTTGKVTLGEGEDAEVFTIGTFCLAKTIKVFTVITELAQVAGLDAAVDAAEGEGFLTRALAILPAALKNGTPAIYRLLGLLVTSNTKLRRLDEDGEDADGYLHKLGVGIAYTASNEQIVTLVTAAVAQMGVETIAKNLPSLLALIRR